jgi:P-type Mg2+ transporter
MGTVVNAGSGLGTVVASGARTEFGSIAPGLSMHQLDTEFQIGLRRFSMLLVYVAGTLTMSIFVINVALHRPIIDALLFSLAIAVGITPQLLPAVVSSSIAAGSRRMSRRKVLVKRLVCIEDLGDFDVLFTDKTGTLTRGSIDYTRAVTAGRCRPRRVAAMGASVHREHGTGRGDRRREPARPGSVDVTVGRGRTRGAFGVRATRRAAVRP